MSRVEWGDPNGHLSAVIQSIEIDVDTSDWYTIHVPDLSTQEIVWLEKVNGETYIFRDIAGRSVSINFSKSARRALSSRSSMKSRKRSLLADLRRQVH